MNQLSRREQKKIDNRNAIFEAAEELFSARGFQGTTLEAISEMTGLSKGTVYLYFKSKEELYLMVCIKGLEGFRGELAKNVKKKKSLEGKIKAIYLTFIEYSMRVPMVFRVVQDLFVERFRQNISEKTLNDIIAAIMEFLNYGSGFVQEGIDAGVFRKDLDPYAFSILCWRIAAGLIELALLKDPKIVEHDSLEHMFDMSIDLLLQGAKSD
ncbi:MAG: TetR/AcrR family transcriptional regulator [Actinobacteria bacterium]|nr:TetR/AcrR family transcriptional regulator [Actinomycetota bacterium]